MHIAMIGPGIMPIPPTGWGALEILIWDLSKLLEKRGHTVTIINTPNMQEIVRSVERLKPDVVHVHYDMHWRIVECLTCKHVIISSHFGLLEQEHLWYPEYQSVFNGFLSLKRGLIHCLSTGIREVYMRHGVSEDRLVVIPNGANVEAFVYRSVALYPEKSIYLGKIETRKRQYVYQSLPFIDFVGNYYNTDFDTKRSNYLKEWPKTKVYEHLTDYANLVLLSEGEAHPLVVCEALVCGLGVVVSEAAAGNLDRSKPFVCVIPDDKLMDLEYVREKILENQRVSAGMRDAIRAYGLSEFSWDGVVDRYEGLCFKMLGRRRLRIAMIGPATPIPPVGWGAVESLIWDYKLTLEKRGDAELLIVNYNDKERIIREVNGFSPNVVHIMYEDFSYLADAFICKNVIITNHYAYLEQLDQRKGDGYWGRFKSVINSGAKIQALSPGVRDMFIKHGVAEDRIRVLHNGANHYLFTYYPVPLYPDRSIYLAKIEQRKRQYIYQGIDGLYFAGRMHDSSFNTRHQSYLGEWTKPILYEQLSQYANLVLLSDGEVHPLVVCEALVCGLGVVVSRVAAANLDVDLPWIDVIPDDRLSDKRYVGEVIARNREQSVLHREAIRAYALERFSWEKVMDQYIQMLETWFQV
jgi:glycosyltransferase involved in cell wall biosynthesis